MAERLVTIFGGSGFVGRHLVNRLTEEGWRVRVAVRDVDGAKFLKPLGELGQVSVVAASATDERSVRRACAGADMAVNLVGILYERGRRTFRALHVEAAGVVAGAAKDAGAQAFVHMSALGASNNNPAEYARTKAAGEEAALAAFPGATIIRPSVIFGPEDNFYNRFASMARSLPVLPCFTRDAPRLVKGESGLAKLDVIGSGGPKLQPVYVKDVCEAIACVLKEESLQGKIYELGGPEVYSMRQILEQVRRESRRNRPIVALPMAVAKAQAAVLQFLPTPPLTPDMVRLMETDSVVSGALPGLTDLGVEPEPVDAILPTYLDQYRPAHRQVRRIDGEPC